MPEPLVPPLEARVERAVREAVAGRRAELEELVRVRLDLELQALAGELVDAQLATNGNGATPAPPEVVEAVQHVALPPPANDAQAPELCAVCGERPRLFARTMCSKCKNRAEGVRRRERRLAEAAAAGDGEELPRPEL